jgi:murein DD-endopeptidase MepM/ murein hydrolase activator NlpD
MIQCPIFLEPGIFFLTSPFGEDRGDHKHGGSDGTRDGKLATYISPEEGFKVTFTQTNIKGTEHSSGNYVELTKWINGKQIVIRIKHMAYGSIPVKVGQILKQGTVIGYMGNTGHSTAEHAHRKIDKRSMDGSISVVNR